MNDKQMKKPHTPSLSTDFCQFWTWSGRRLNRWNVIFSAALALLFAGCVGEEEVDESKNGTPLTITAASLKSEAVASVQTRSATTLSSGRDRKSVV